MTVRNGKVQKRSLQLLDALDAVAELPTSGYETVLHHTVTRGTWNEQRSYRISVIQVPTKEREEQ